MRKIILLSFLTLFISIAFSQENDFTVCKHGKSKYKNAFLKQPVIEEQSWIDAVYYKLDLNFSVSPNELTGEVTGRFKILQDGVNEIVLNFAEHTYSGANWLDFSVSGQTSSYQIDGNLLRITLDQTYNENDLVSVTVNYRGRPEHSGLTYVENLDHMVISSLSEPFYARTWWPCKDIPKDKADSVDIIITVPDNMIAASNGTLVSTVNNGNGTKTYSWEERYPITTYLVSVAISEYSFFEEVWSYDGHNMPLHYYCLPEDSATATYFFDVMPDILTAFSDYFGTYPFIEEKYGHAYYMHGGAMEHQTLSSFSRVYITNDRVYAHELGHQWFGDLTTCENWSEIWMNEGFASYTEALWKESQEGFEAYLNAIHYYVPSPGNYLAGKIYVTDTTNTGSIFSATVYRKGMWVLHMLRFVLGDETFFEILSNYAFDERFKYKTATTEKFKNYCEEISGNNLETFFDQWIYEYGYPMYEWNWGTIGSDSIFLVVRQNQSYDIFNHDVPYYEMPLEFSLNYNDGTKDTITVLNQAVQNETFIIPVNKPVTLADFDPTGWILCDKDYNPNLDPDTINGDGFVPSDFRIIETYPNPFPNPGNPVLSINFVMPVAGNVKMEIYNVMGQLIYSKFQNFPQSSYQRITWNGNMNTGGSAPSGVYLIRLKQKKQKSYTATVKALKVK